MNKTQTAVYRHEEDAPFLPKSIFSKELFAPGISAEPEGEDFRLTKTERGGSYILRGEFAKCYEVKFSPDSGVVTALTTAKDPRTVQAGELLESAPAKCDFATQDCFMFVCRSDPEYLMICLSGDATEISIEERTILQDTDTTGPWFVPELVGSITEIGGTFGSYQWTAQQVLDNLYEPYRAKYPDYITRTHLGKDQSGEYDMYGYVYTPKEYKATLFLTGGIHANEEPAYFSLAKLMQLISDATPDDALLYPLRQHVRFVVVPVVNVWGVSQNHDRSREEVWKRIRRNSSDVDMNRDFEDLTQQETKNVMAFLREYAHEIDMAMDFHNSKRQNCYMWYNFINNAVNACVNYKTTNHMYHRLMELGICPKTPQIKEIPGSYHKTAVYMEGRPWTEFSIPTITVEHQVHEAFPPLYSSEGLTLGVEVYGNFLIQNALFFLSKNQ